MLKFSVCPCIQIMWKICKHKAFFCNDASGENSMVSYCHNFLIQMDNLKWMWKLIEDNLPFFKFILSRKALFHEKCTNPWHPTVFSPFQNIIDPCWHLNLKCELFVVLYWLEMFSGRSLLNKQGLIVLSLDSKGRALLITRTSVIALAY